MAERSIGIYLGEDDPTCVGTAYFHGFGSRLRTTFSYDAEWLENPSSFQLAPEAPLSARSIQCSGLPGFLADAAPDRWGRHLIFRGAQNDASRSNEQLRSLDDVDYLMGVDDWSRMGALRISADGGSTFLGSGTDVPKLVRLPQLLSAARSVDAGTDGWQQVKSLLDAGSSSLGGARPKATIVDGGQLWLAKFPGSHDEWDVITWEAWALDMAERSGIAVPAHRVQTVGRQSVLLSARFDRCGEARVPYLSGMTLLNLSDGSDADYYDLADALRAESASPAEDLSELFRRIAFSIAIHNTDDHLRNHGLLHTDAGWRLSPVFDVNPNPFADVERVLSVYGERGHGEVDSLPALAQSMGVSNEALRAAVLRVLAALDGWQAHANRLGCQKREIDLFSPVIAEHCAELRRII